VTKAGPLSKQRPGSGRGISGFEQQVSIAHVDSRLGPAKAAGTREADTAAFPMKRN
jgi:hypothetical protein